MKIAYSVFFAAAVFAAHTGGMGFAGQAGNPNSLETGMRYCPAPWCDNSEFIDTHFGIDAKTGKITKYTGTIHPDETQATSNPGEQVLYSAPAPQVDNRYVPAPGTAVAQIPPPQPSRPLPAATAPRTYRPNPVASPPPTRSGSIQPSRNRGAGNGAFQSRADRSKGDIAARNPGQKKLPWWKGMFRK